MLSNHPSVLGSGAAGVTTPAAASAALDLISTTQGAMLYRNATVWVALDPGTAGQLLSTQGAAANPIWVTATGGAGDMNGPASATDNAIVRFDGTGGKTVQNSAVTIADTTGSISINGTDTATAVNTGGFKSANFGLSTVSGGASYFGGNVTITKVGSDATLTISGGVASYAIANFNPNASTTNNFAILAETGGVVYFQQNNGAITPLRFAANGATTLSASTKISDATTANNSYTGALVVGNGSAGSAATNVALGYGNINAGGTGTFGGTTPSTGIGTGALQVAGGIYAGAASVFGGAVTTGGALAITASGQAGAKATITNTDAASYSHLDLSSSSGQNSALYQFGSTYATAGRYVQGSMMLEAGGSGGLNLATSAATPIRFYTNGDNVRLAIASDGAATFSGAVSVSGTTATWTSGTGSPESVKAAPVGSLYTRTDGGASTTLYIKESGSGNTGWVAK